MSSAGGHAFDGVAIVTGAGGGIGTAIALELARSGAKLALVDYDAQAAERTAAEVEAASPGTVAVPIGADVTSGEQVAAYVERTATELGPPGVLVNNAGTEGRVRLIHEFSEEEFDAVMAVNTRGTWLNIKHVAPLMLQQGSGVIVNMASGGALYALPKVAPYVASKHAVLGLTRSAASDLAAGGIRVNAVCPGPVDTRMIASLEQQRAADGGTPEEQRARLTGRIPLGRYATPAEIAGVVAFLASGAASFVTGAVIVADGGVTAV